MALESDQPMLVGEFLSFNIEKNSAMSVSVDATVCYRFKSQQRFIFGVKFYHQGKDQESKAFILEAIETLLAIS